jgi:acyl-coenzyme A thioesterase PaaI-like protein
MDVQDRLDEAELRSFLAALPFVHEFGISVVAYAPGEVTIELPFAERFFRTADAIPGLDGRYRR